MSSKKLSTLTIFIFLLIILTACLPNTGGGEVEQVPTMPPTATTAPSLPTEPPPPTATPVPTAVPTLEKIPAPDASPAASAMPPDPIAAPCQRPNGWVDYIIQRGDTLSTLARRTGSTVQEIKTVNCLTSDVIYYGQILFLPQQAGSVPTTPAATAFIVPTNTSAAELPPPAFTSTSTPTSTSESNSPPTNTATATSTTEIIPPGGPGDPRLLISPSSGPIGTTHTVTLENYDPNETVIITIVFTGNGETVFSTFTTLDSMGNGTFQFFTEPGDEIGVYSLNAKGQDGWPSLYGQFRITS